MKDFVHLHLHTECSLLDGAVRIGELVKHVGENELGAVAVTDHGNMMGIYPFFDAVAEWNKAIEEQVKNLLDSDEEKAKPGANKEKIAALNRKLVKPIAGVEAYITFGRDTKESQHYHLVLLAENETGYKNLCLLVSESYRAEKYYRHPVITYDSLLRYNEGIICSTACLAGPLSLPIKDWTLVTPADENTTDRKTTKRIPIQGNIESSRNNLRLLKKAFPGRLYIELMLHPFSGLSNTNNAYHPQSYVLAALLLLAKESGLPVLVTNDVHFLHKEDARIHQMMVCIGVNTKYASPGKLVYSHEEYFKTHDELRSVFAQSYPDIAEKYIQIQKRTGVENPEFLAEDEYLNYIDQGLANTVTLAEGVKSYKLKRKTPLMPDFDIPDAYRLAPFLEEMDPEKGEAVRERRVLLETFAYLKDLTYEGARLRWKEKLTEERIERLEYELETILKMGFPGYFLIVRDFINFARSHNYGVGPGRGSAAGSAVSYCLEITNLDPLKYDLLFERFLNPDRVSLPDIDVDLDDRSRQLVIQYLRDKYGSEHVGGVVTLGSSMIKNAINDVARVLEMPDHIAAQVRLALKNDEEFVKTYKVKEVKKGKLKEYLEHCPNLRALRDSDDPTMATFMKDVQAMEGRMRNIGQHACGYVICKTPLQDAAPTMRLQSGKSDGAIIQYEGGVLESIGLVKMDLLGLRTIQILARAIDEIEKSIGKKINLDEIDLEDADTLALLGRGETIEIFQFESPGMRNNLRLLKPTGLEDLIAMNALFRPGPLENIPAYIRRKHGLEKPKYDLPCMEKILESTYGITVYQEQVMALSREIAGFSRGDSDILRKAIGKKKEDLMAEMKEKFIKGALERKHPIEKIEKIWGEWVHFANYAFNRSHAACYAYIAMHAAYLKAHHPREYMVACLQSETTSTRLEVVVQECIRMGIKILLPDINRSGDDFQIEGKDIRFGLTRIKGINSKQVLEIIQERQTHGPFTDIEDFLKRNNEKRLPLRLFYELAQSGALDGIAPHGQRIAFFNIVKTDTEGNVTRSLDELFEYGKSLRAYNVGGMLLGLRVAMPELRKQPPTEEERMELLNQERELLKVYISGHPLDPYKLEVMSAATLSISILDSQQAAYKGQVVRLAGMLSVPTQKVKEGDTKNVSRKRDDNKSLYQEFTLEDYTGTVRLFLLTEEAEGKYREIFRSWERVAISIRVDYNEKSGRYRYNVLNMDSLEAIRNRGIAKFSIEVNSNSTPETLHELSSLLELYPGATPLEIELFDQKTRKYVHYPASKRRLRVELPLVENLLEQEIPFRINDHAVQQNLFSIVDRGNEEGEEEINLDDIAPVD